jgi:hypothetical protein
LGGWEIEKAERSEPLTPLGKEGVLQGVHAPLKPNMPFFLLMAMSSTVMIMVAGTLPFRLYLFSLPCRGDDSQKSIKTIEARSIGLATHLGAEVGETRRGEHKPSFLPGLPRGWTLLKDPSFLLTEVGSIK